MMQALASQSLSALGRTNLLVLLSLIENVRGAEVCRLAAQAEEKT